jgi:hypothetical protein
MYIRLLVTVSVLLLFSGCAIHPVPEDVTGVDTFTIVKQIRCETRKAVIDFLKRELHRQADLGGDPVAQKLLAQYESNPEAINAFKPDLFPGPDYVQYRHFYNQIYSAAIAYNFDLTMTENNNLGTNLDFLGPWKSKFTLNVTGDANRQRTNERTFTITDTFQFLLADLNRADETGVLYCDGHIAQANYIYPIAGEIGVYKTVKTFFQLAVLGGLSADKAKPGSVGAPTMVDNLKFTTTVDLSGTPKVVFSPIGSGFQIADASLTGMAQRMDVHQVTVGLAVLPGGAADAGSLRGFLFPGAGAAGRVPGLASRAPGLAGRGIGGGPLYVGNRVTANGGTPAEWYAANAIDQVKIREIQLITTP